MSESIVTELLEETASLRKQLAAIQELGFTSQIIVLEKAPVMKIRGVLIAEGVWKGVKYTYEAMKEALPKFQKLVGKVMHSKSDEFKDTSIGILTKVTSDDLLRAIPFEAEVTDRRAAELVADGTFNAVSIKGGFEKLDTSTTPPVGIDYSPIEWSLTGSPACSSCMIFNFEELELSLNNPKEQTLIGEIGMSEDQIEIKEGEVLVLPANFEELEDLSEFDMEIMSISALIELSKKGDLRTFLRCTPGKYPKEYKKGYKYGDKAFSKIPGYEYGKPKKKVKLETIADDLLDILPLEKDYREFMKKCMKEEEGPVTDRMKSCAAKFKKLEDDGEDIELAKDKEIKCPACDEMFTTPAEFKKHWAEKHEEKYGKYGQVKKLTAKMLEDNVFRSGLKKTILALEAPKETPATPPKEKPKEEVPTPQAPTITIPAPSPVTTPVPTADTMTPVSTPVVTTEAVTAAPTPAPAIDWDAYVKEQVKKGKGPELIAQLFEEEAKNK